MVTASDDNATRWSAALNSEIEIENVSLLNEKHYQYLNVLNDSEFAKKAREKIDDFTEWGQATRPLADARWDKAPVHIKAVSGHVNIQLLDEVLAKHKYSDHQLVKQYEGGNPSM